MILQGSAKNLAKLAICVMVLKKANTEKTVAIEGWIIPFPPEECNVNPRTLELINTFINKY